MSAEHQGEIVGRIIEICGNRAVITLGDRQPTDAERQAASLLLEEYALWLLGIWLDSVAEKVEVGVYRRTYMFRPYDPYDEDDTEVQP